MYESSDGCEWPDGCNQGGFREVDTAPIDLPGRRWLCLKHAGDVWETRRRANRAAGRCTCGAAVTPGFASCPECREAARLRKRLGRNLTRYAAQCGITLPREAGRRRAFFDAYSRAFVQCQDRAARAYRRRLGWALNPAPATARASVGWEGHVVTCEARYGLRGDGYVTGIPEAREAGR